MLFVLLLQFQKYSLMERCDHLRIGKYIYIVLTT